MKKCFVCGSENSVIAFNNESFKKCFLKLLFRREKKFAYSEVRLCLDSIQELGYHSACYKKVTVLSKKYKEEFTEFCKKHDGLNNEDEDLDIDEEPGTSSQCENEEPLNESACKVFCPQCNTEVSHTAGGVQEDQTKVLVANVYRYLTQEYEELKEMYGSIDLSPLSKISSRTAMATGVSEATVLQILKEEERSTVCQSVEEPPKRARKRTRKSRSKESSSDDEIGEFEQTRPQAQEQLETLVVKVEPSENYEGSEMIFTPVEVKLEATDGEASGPQVDPIAVEVKTEPRDDVGKRTNDPLAPDVPATNKDRGRKKQRTDDVTTRQHTQDHTSTARASSSVPTRELDEISSLAEGAIKTEQIEIHKEGFS